MTDAHSWGRQPGRPFVQCSEQPGVVVVGVGKVVVVVVAAGDAAGDAPDASVVRPILVVVQECTIWGDTSPF